MIDSALFRTIDPCDWKRLCEISAIDREAFQEDGLTPANLSLMARSGFLFALEVNSRLTAEAVLLRQKKETDAFLFSLAVLKEFQNQGHGRHLMLTICRQLAQMGFQSIELTVAPDNPAALHLYLERLKFQKIALIADHLGPGKDRWLVRGALTGGFS